MIRDYQKMGAIYAGIAALAACGGAELARAIAPPARYRDTRIAGSYDDNVQPRTPSAPDPERVSAAEAKRLRKAAKRRETMK